MNPLGWDAISIDSMLDKARDWHFLLFVWLVEWIDSRHLPLFIDALNVDRYAIVSHIRHHR
jgi:hypothetical protein